MARPKRILDPSLHFHVIARFNNEGFCLEEKADFERYLSILRLVQNKHGFQLFNYELMNSHVHLFVQPGPDVPFSKTMHLVNWRYALNYNRKKKRKGNLWLDRYKCIPVQSDRYALALMRYMNRNPLRAGMVERAGQWSWSGFGFYARGETNELLTPHPSYLAISSYSKCRQKEYEILVNETLEVADQRDPHFSEGPYIGSRQFGENLQNLKP